MRATGWSRRELVLAVALLAHSIWAVARCPAADRAERPRRIAVFGSSVAMGSGATPLDQHGYQARLRRLLGKRGWEVVQCSVGGDTTPKLHRRFDRDLLSKRPGYVFIGLSLANEGIRRGGRAEKDAVYEQYRTGMLGLIRRIREHGMVPVVGLCYPHGRYTSVERDYIERMNLLINSWDVPSVNFLGAVGDGDGRWAKGCENDPGHPNNRGHEAMFRAFVPVLFDALAAGKPIPTRPRGRGFVRIGGPDEPASHIVCMPKDPLQAWSIAVSVRTETDGLVAWVGNAKAAARVTLERGRFVYASSTGTMLELDRPGADGRWHHVVVSHRYAAGRTTVYVDAKDVGSVDEQFAPVTFGIGRYASPPAKPPTGGKEADYRGWFIYRAALNLREVSALAAGKLVQASLELYAPLCDRAFADGKPVENRAQSLTDAVVVGKGGIQPVPE